MRNIFLFFVCLAQVICAQTYSAYKTNWKDAGYKGAKPNFTLTVNIMNYGGNNTNAAANNNALSSAIAALNGKPGTVYFPPGVYSFTGQVTVNRDSIAFKGAGYDSTKLKFNLSGILNNCLNINGSQNNADTTSFTQAGKRDSNSVTVLNSSLYQVNQWVYLQCTDNTYMASTWAYGSLGQIMQIKTIVGSKITFNSPFRFNYKLSLQPKIKRIIPRNNISFQCMQIHRLDATSNQTSLISFDKAVNCWVNGIEGDSTNYAHIEFSRASNCEVTNSYFHHAYAYGGSGQGYGIALQYSANEIRIENNIFNNLRHSMLLQAGANGNVLAYNYSFNPFWTGVLSPSNSAGDMVLHGNYPFSNLFEGNICQNIVIDNSHAQNGPYNTFFRNRAELYGIVMNNTQVTDTVQFLGNECVNTGVGLGNYLLFGNGHNQFGNMIKNVLTPAATNNITDKTLYLQPGQAPLCFVNGLYNWPVIGLPNGYNTGTNAAKSRALQNKWALCSACATATITTALQEESIKVDDALVVYPNPVDDKFLYIKSQINYQSAIVYDALGKIVIAEFLRQPKINVQSLPKGMYVLELRTSESSQRVRFVKD
jgi:hypothetical protein